MSSGMRSLIDMAAGSQVKKGTNLRKPDQYRRVRRATSRTAFQVALDGGGTLALAFLGGLLARGGAPPDSTPAFSQERLKRRSATSDGSFSFTFTEGIKPSTSL